tara:strand:- start:628 stop:1410 length:783 start_codon:yes stop_codon:yes gene_type:complete
MKIEKITLFKMLRVLSVMAQVCIFITFSLTLVVQLEVLNYNAYPINSLLFSFIIVTFLVGFLGATIVFCNLKQVRVHRPDFALLVFVCLLPMVMFQYIYGIQNVSLDAVNDVSTNVNDPPQFKLSRVDRYSPNYNDQTFLLLKAPNQISAHPDISKVTLLAPTKLVYNCSIVAAQSLNWRVSIRDPSAKVIEAKAVIRFLSNELDTVIRVRDVGEGYSSIDIRSASPNGRADGGLNVFVIRKFISVLKRTLVNRRDFEYC